MTIWIDPPAWPAHGTLWSHLVSDASIEELHAFAADHAGIPRRGEGDHYDVPEERYAALVAGGAQPIGGRELLRLLQASGLRVPKRRHERVLHSQAEPPWLPAGSRVDVIPHARTDRPPALPSSASWRTQGRCSSSADTTVGSTCPAVRSATRRRRTLGELQREVLGDQEGAELVGYVRNTVPAGDTSYPWPVPRACFAVYAREVDEARPFGGGTGSPSTRPPNASPRGTGGYCPEFFSHPRHGHGRRA